MSVLLHASGHLPPSEDYDCWMAVGDTPARLDEAKIVQNLPDRLEQAYEKALRRWSALAYALAHGTDVDLAHTPSCASNASDFGQMLAWSDIVEQAAATEERLLVLCDDPWMFRHLASLSGVTAEQPPALWRHSAYLTARGYMARCKVAFAVFKAMLKLRSHASRFPSGVPAVLVYGHPSSSASYDGYFGDLMARLVDLTRLLHVDCPLPRALELARDGRTFSLHAWGKFSDIVRLPFAKWRPAIHESGASVKWLLRRSAVVEGSSGQAAMILWQNRCQARWLAATHPRSVAWPWENHAWERGFVRACSANGARTIGYQHATVGRFELNYALACITDGLSSTPDVLVASGPVGYRALLLLGYAAERVRDGGAFRYQSKPEIQHDKHAPIFVALPSDPSVGAEMVEAMRPIARSGKDVLVRDHPMTPFAFAPEPRLRHSSQPLHGAGPLSAVVFAGTTVGLEARIAGLPTFRFKPSRKIANDVIPFALSVPSVTGKDLIEIMTTAQPCEPIDHASVFSVPDFTLWAELLGAEQAA